MTQSPFARSDAQQAPQGSPFGQRAAAPAPSAPAPAQSRGFAVKRERPDKYPTALDLMPSKIKGNDGALVIIRVERILRDQPGQTGGTYDAYDTKTWILDAPRNLPDHMLEAGSEVDGAWYLPEMRWSGAGLVRDLEHLLDNRQLFVGRVGSYKPKVGPERPEFVMATDAELERAQAYLDAHPEVDFPKTTFARSA